MGFGCCALSPSLASCYVSLLSEPHAPLASLFVWFPLLPLNVFVLDTAGTRYCCVSSSKPFTIVFRVSFPTSLVSSLSFALCSPRRTIRICRPARKYSTFVFVLEGLVLILTCLLICYNPRDSTEDILIKTGSLVRNHDQLEAEGERRDEGGAGGGGGREGLKYVDVGGEAHNLLMLEVRPVCPLGSRSHQAQSGNDDAARRSTWHSFQPATVWTYTSCAFQKRACPAGCFQTPPSVQFPMLHVTIALCCA